MPLFLPLDNSIETSSIGSAASTVAVAQTVLLHTVTTRNYPVFLSFMECYLTAVNASNPVIELGIYSWNGSSGGTLLSSGTVTPSAAGFAQVTFASPITLSARTRYYMAYLNRKSADATTTLACGGGNTNGTLISAAMASQATMPASLSGLVTTNAQRLNLRAWT